MRRRARRRDDPAAAAQDLVHGGERWRRHAVALQTARYLARAPCWMRVAYGEHLRLDRRFTAPRASMRSPRPVGKFRIASLLPRQPFVADVRTDPEPPA